MCNAVSRNCSNLGEIEESSVLRSEEWFEMRDWKYSRRATFQSWKKRRASGKPRSFPETQNQMLKNGYIQTHYFIWKFRLWLNLLNMHQDQKKTAKSSNGRVTAQKCKYERIVMKVVTRSSINKNGSCQTRSGRLPYCQRRHKWVEILLFNCTLGSKQWNRKTLSPVLAISGALKAK